MSPKILNIALILVLVVLSLAVLANSMTKPIGRDEQMYCTAGVLMAQGKTIYRDFSYASQMPYHPLLYAAVFRISNTTYYLLTGRIISVICDILVIICIAAIFRRIFSHFRITGMLLAMAAAILYVFNPLVDYANGYAWNHDVVNLCVMLSFWLFISIDFAKESKYYKIALIAALLTFATCMRITTALVQLLFFIILLLQSAGSAKQRFKNVQPFLIAAAVILIWPFWIIASAPRAFFLNLLRIPILYGQWLHEIDMVHNKFDLILTSLTTPGYLLLIITALCLWPTLIFVRHRLQKPHKYNCLLAILLPLVLFIIALIPPTMWTQYLAMPVPMLIVSFAYPLLYLRKMAEDNSLKKYFTTISITTVVCVFITILSYPVVLYRIPRLLNPQAWTPIRLHRISKDIAAKTKTPKLALTLAPLYALEGGCNIYPQLSCGSIIYRAADYLSDAQRTATNTVGPKTLREMIEKKPPSVVILGVEFDFLEEPLFQLATRPDWQRQTFNDDNPIAYFKP